MAPDCLPVSLFFLTNFCSSADWMTKIIIARVIHSLHPLFLLLLSHQNQGGGGGGGGGGGKGGRVVFAF